MRNVTQMGRRALTLPKRKKEKIIERETERQKRRKRIKD